MSTEIDTHVTVPGDGAAAPIRATLSTATPRAASSPVPGWSGARRAYPNRCAHELFERQVELTPDAIAVVSGDRTLTYRELNERANQVAHFLRRREVGPDSLVGVALERSPELVVGLLGVWKAGGAYVPLDPTYPQDRLSFMVQDAELSVVVTEERCEHLFSSARTQTICLDTQWPELSKEDVGNPDPRSTPANLAYVMYTSGSTGQPKGAMIVQSGLVNYLCWAIEAYGVEPGGSVPVHSSISFDLTVTSLFPALLKGGRVDMLPESGSALNLAKALRGSEIRTLIKITPAHLDLFNQQLATSEAASLTRAFVIGGENLPAESLTLWRSFAPNTRLFNEYGPTETVVGCCVYEVKGMDPPNGSVPIGYPIANTQLYVLDELGQRVPPGTLGEMYIGGAGVARGYLNRPELTAERFIPDPFSGEQGARLYKTGDLVRLRDDGVFEYAGRVDNQVKIRGYRIELGEIEAAVLAHPSVQSCAVLAREDTPGNRQLVAYAVAKQGESFRVEELQRLLVQRLPSYMVPAQFVTMDALPLTSNGKVDRKALLAPGSVVESGPDRKAAAPRNEIERGLVEMWAELLGVKQVGIDDDFFDIGGHSLLSIKTLSRIRNVFQVELPADALFDAPTVAKLAILIAHAKGSSDAENRRIVSRGDGGPCPLSFNQEQYWLLHQLSPQSPAYNIIDVALIRGAYDAPAMKRAFAELTRRHGVLRTVFIEMDSRAMQSVLPAAEILVPETDLTHVPEADREKEWARVVHEQGRVVFDLRRAPLLRALVVHVSAAEHRVLLTIHHIIADEWSMQVLQQDLAALYEAEARGAPSPLSPLPIQYTDFARWQREWLAGDVLAEQVAFWKKELAGASFQLELQTDRPRPAFQSLRGATTSFSLPNQLLQRLQELGRAEQATLFMVLEASFATLLHRYTGQDDILVGTPISARTQSETERLLGCFLNTIVLRSQFAEATTFRSLLGATRDRALGAYVHADLPFDRVVASLLKSRDPGRPPLFQVMFVLHDRDSISQVSNVSKHDVLETGTSKFDLTLFMSESEAGLEGLVEYSTDLFEEGTIRRLCTHFGELLRALVERPDQPVWQAPLLSEAERRSVHLASNGTDAQWEGADEGLHRAFEKHATKTPDRIAVVSHAGAMTYGELNRRANQLAHYLSGQGVGEDTLVGILLERSLDMVVAMFGVLKAGGAYLPLDPAFPPDRLAYMIKNSGMPVLVTHRDLDGNLPAQPPLVVRLDRDADRIGSEPDTCPSLAVRPDDLAYVLYTSGSTGMPKGVAIGHGAIVNLLRSMEREPGLGPEDTLVAVTTLSFDIAELELHLPLMVGAKVVLASREDAIAPERLLRLMRDSGCTVMQATPATWRALIGAGWAGSPDMTALCGGEALSPELAKELLCRCKELWNMYGPTETTIWSTVHRVMSAEGPIPIGKPIANTQTYVLDAHRQLLPAGVVGELYIGGLGLARGYLHLPELTEQRFVVCPFDPNARLYRTGDLARWGADGTLECLGRTDHQVKLRGFRIELGEIESALSKHGAVRQAVVVAREDVPGDKRLVAYVVASQEASGTLADELRAFLRAGLPEYMVPSHFVQLSAFPLTPNGKVDQKALPAPDARSFGSGEPLVAPRSELEATIAKIWEEVLGAPVTSMGQNFFDLGGHSLLAIKVLSRTRDALRVDLPVQALFDFPTAERFAAEVGRVAGGVQRVPNNIEVRAGEGPWPLSYSQEQFWLLDQFVPGSPAYNVVDEIRFAGDYDGRAMKNALGALLRRHGVLRTCFTTGQGCSMQSIVDEVDVALREVDLRALPEKERAEQWQRLVHEQAQKPFDLTRAPLLRASLAKWSASEQKLLLVLHHIVVDEWSMELVRVDLRELYESFRAGRASKLPELLIQYKDFACWQRDWLEGEVLDAQLAYWKKELAGGSYLFDLPTDRPRPPTPSLRGATQTFRLPNAVCTRLHALARAERATLFMVLEASFAALLHRYTGQEDILVGTPISRRVHRETERLVGCFLNTVVIRHQFTDGSSFRSLVGATRDHALGAYAHADVPFDRVVASVLRSRDSSRTPLFQVMFVLHDPDGAASVSTVFGHLGLETGTSKFDLTLFMSETEEGIDGLIEYSTELFEEGTIRRLCTHFGELLTALVERPDQPLWQAPLLSEAERRVVDLVWNGTDVQWEGEDEGLHRAFEKQAAKTPDRIAVVSGAQSITYGELNRRANQLAQYLTVQGVGPDVLVGLLLDRSLDMMVALFGVLKAGGAYLPLDPAFPPDRLAYMIQNSGMPVLVTHRDLDRNLATRPPRVVRLDQDDQQIALQPEASPNPGLYAENLAYVLYTSGSTGRPKGVAIGHGAIVNLLRSVEREPGLTAEDTLLAVTTLSFDIAEVDMHLPLMVGAKMVLASREDAMDMARLIPLLDESGCTVMQATPATWWALLAAGWRGSAEMTVLCTGEAMPPDLATALLGRCKALFNLYGPTETTVWSTIQRIVSVDGPIPIGKPIANTQTYVLDAHRQLVPAGVVGELYIGGLGLARGYLHLPELTEQRFVVCPFDPNARLYRTGDLARWGADGTLECLGRTDHQVKLRGFRIELGEIESALSKHAAVRQAVVVAREDVPGDKRLVAYVVASQEASGTLADELRALLRAGLPEYMVPSHFVQLSAFPLTPNGKVDQKALPAPDARSIGSSEPLVAPRGEVEVAIAKIWEDALGARVASIRHNFFDLGGNSLLATQVFAKIADATGVSLPLSVLIEGPTIEHLAKRIRQRSKTKAHDFTYLVTVRAGGSRPALFCVHGGGGNVLVFQQVAAHMVADRPIYGFQARGVDGVARPHHTIEEMAQAYLEELRATQPHGPYYLAGYCGGGLIAYELAHILRDAGEPVALLALVECYRPGQEHSTRFRTWRRALNERTATELLRLGRLRVQKNYAAARDEVLTRYHEARGGVMPYELRDHWLTQAIIRATALYRLRPYPGQLSVFFAKDGNRGDNGALLFPDLGADLGWGAMASGRVDTYEIPGGHESLLRTPGVQILASKLDACLEKAASSFR